MISEESEKKIPLFIFKLHGRSFGIHSESVQEIVSLPKLTPVEEAPDYIAGIFNLRGKLLPVMDMDLRFGRPSRRYLLTDNVIIIEAKGIWMGIIVNEVLDVLHIPEEDIEEEPDYGQADKAHPHFISGEVKVESDIIILLDHSNLISYSQPQEEITEAEFKKPSHPAYFEDAPEDEKKVFHERALSLMQPPEGEAFAEQIAMAVFRQSGEYFAVDLAVVRGFSDIALIAPVPCCPDHVIGNMNLHGNILTLVDIRKVLNMPLSEINLSGRVMIAEHKALTVGVVVDELVDVTYVAPSEIMNVPAAVKSLGGEYLRGTTKYEDQLMTILDLQKILEKGELIVDEAM